MSGVITGLLLAAGAGTRMGLPKALVHSPTGESWLARSVHALRRGGCDAVVVVLGAEADRARPLVPGGVEIVTATDWAAGQSASLRSGLQHLSRTPAGAALVHLVDLPDVGPEVVAAVLRAAHATRTPLEALLCRATHGANPGHPVLIGAAHWPALMAELTGDRGARDYLREHPVVDVECGHLASGMDVDRA